MAQVYESIDFQIEGRVRTMTSRKFQNYEFINMFKNALHFSERTIMFATNCTTKRLMRW